MKTGSHRKARVALSITFLALLAVAGLFLGRSVQTADRIHVVAYFENSNGVFTGDDVRIRGVRVGKIESIHPEPDRVKITFWVDGAFPVPADVKAVIISPTLVTARAVQLTPPYKGGPVLQDDAVISADRTAVPIEWDDFRLQLQKLTETLQPNESGGASTLGQLVDTAANNLRGQGAAIRNAIVKLAQAVSILNDHSGDAFSSVKNLATLVHALQDSTDLMAALNRNLASVSGLLANHPGEVSQAVADLNAVVGQVSSFIADNRETIGTTSDKLASVSQTLTESLDDIKQALHVLPTTLANANNVYRPAQGTLSGVAAVNNFANPISFLCGAIQAASRLGAEQSAKLCVQYLAPIVKNRQYNFPPLGFNPIVGAMARPNEITYSEDRLRPDYVPPQLNQHSPTPTGPIAALPAEAPLPPTPKPTDPADGLPGLMLPTQGGGS